VLSVALFILYLFFFNECNKNKLPKANTITIDTVTVIKYIIKDPIIKIIEVPIPQKVLVLHNNDTIYTVQSDTVYNDSIKSSYLVYDDSIMFNLNKLKYRICTRDSLLSFKAFLFVVDSTVEQTIKVSEIKYKEPNYFFYGIGYQNATISPCVGYTRKSMSFLIGGYNKKTFNFILTRKF
jgi:hypothetical protein